MPVPDLKPITINAGESLSTSVYCAGGEIIRINGPFDWTPAMLSMQTSPDGVVWRDARERDRELGFDLVPGSAIMVRPFTMRGIFYMRLRSGSREKPVPQTAKRDFQVLLLP